MQEEYDWHRIEHILLCTMHLHRYIELVRSLKGLVVRLSTFGTSELGYDAKVPNNMI